MLGGPLDRAPSELQIDHRELQFGDSACEMAPSGEVTCTVRVVRRRDAGRGHELKPF